MVSPRGRISQTPASATITAATATTPIRRPPRRLSASRGVRRLGVTHLYDKRPSGAVERRPRTAPASTQQRSSMRVAVITDIHSNLPALEAVLAEIADSGFDQVWCLGDVVGYGAQPDECTTAVRESCDVCLVGNHDLAVLGDLDISSFSSAAAEAAIWTRERITSSSVEYLRPLTAEGEREGVGLFHASPRDPVWEYVLSVEQAEDCMELQAQRVTL